MLHGSAGASPSNPYAVFVEDALRNARDKTVIKGTQVGTPA